MRLQIVFLDSISRSLENACLKNKKLKLEKNCLCHVKHKCCRNYFENSQSYLQVSEASMFRKSLILEQRVQFPYSEFSNSDEDLSNSTKQWKFTVSQIYHYFNVCYLD